MDGCRGCRVAGYDECFDPVLTLQPAADRAGPMDQVIVIPLTLGRMATVGDIDKPLERQLGPERPQDAQATQAAVKHPDGVHALDWQWLNAK